MFDYISKLRVLGAEGDFVLAGDSALYHAGLTNQPVDTPMCWTEHEDIPSGIFALVVYYYFNPKAKDVKYTSPTDMSSGIHEPTKERALIETIKFHEYFNEGILIEALQNYLRNPNMDLLYEVADYFNVDRKDVDYWINEANEESDMSMG